MCSRAASALVLGAHSDTACSEHAVSALEEALQVVAELAGGARLGRLGISGAKDWLRRRAGEAGQSLVARGVRLNKARNAAAHIDIFFGRGLRAGRLSYMEAGGKSTMSW